MADAVKVLALLVKLPLMLTVEDPVAVLIQTAPPLRVKSTNEDALLVPLKFIVPVMFVPPVAPFTIKGREHVSVPPLLIVKEPTVSVVLLLVTESVQLALIWTLPVTVQLLAVVMVLLFWIINTSAAVVKLAGLVPVPFVAVHQLANASGAAFVHE